MCHFILVKKLSYTCGLSSSDLTISKFLPSFFSHVFNLDDIASTGVNLLGLCAIDLIFFDHYFIFPVFTHHGHLDLW